MRLRIACLCVLVGPENCQTQLSLFPLKVIFGLIAFCDMLDCVTSSVTFRIGLRLVPRLYKVSPAMDFDISSLPTLVL